MSTIATFSNEQQIAAFTFSVNSAAGLSFTSLVDMQAYVTNIATINLADSIQQGLMGSDWVLVWGPVVWTNPAQTGQTYIVDNTMSCYYSPSQKLFVIAIAGTNPTSMFDWKDEDIDISSMVQWNTISQGSGSASGYISAGTATGINALLGMTNGTSTLLVALQNYIRINAISGATIAIGGHSLGGALAPCFGLYLLDNGGLRQNIAVYVYAGPTPGNQVFAEYYQSKINTTTFTYCSIYNTIDVVPQGLVIEDLATVPTIYGTNIPLPDNPPNTFIGVLATGLQLASYAGSFAPGIFYQSFYTQITPRSPFTASFNSDVYNNCSTQVINLLDAAVPPVSSSYMTELGNIINFMYQVGAQHGPAYCGGTITLPLPTITNPSNLWTSQPVEGQLKIDAYTVEFQKNLSANPPASAIVKNGIGETIKRISRFDITKIQPKTR